MVSEAELATGKGEEESLRLLERRLADELTSMGRADPTDTDTTGYFPFPGARARGHEVVERFDTFLVRCPIGDGEATGVVGASLFVRGRAEGVELDPYQEAQLVDRLSRLLFDQGGDE